MTVTSNEEAKRVTLATPPTSRPARRSSKLTESSLFLKSLPWLSFALFLGLWELAARQGWVDVEFFSSPTEVWHAGVDAVQTSSFWHDVWVSTQEFTIGYVLAVVVAIPLGLLSGLFKRVQYMTDPWLSALNAIPRIALTPLIVLWFGLGLESKIAVVFLGASVSIAINTFDGTRSVNRDFLDVSTAYGASWRRRMVSVIVPGVMPFVMVGMRLAVGRAIAGVMVGEYFTSDAGLGNFIFRAGQTLQTGKLLFGSIAVTLLSLLAFKAISSVEKRFSKWRPAVGSAA